ncbi:hypothetical protein SmphiM6_99 [Sinorhizobium phage phiM6]|nr:hypothetical protein SmphiM6_99 [Sinorhizobium phage phiM6]
MTKFIVETFDGPSKRWNEFGTFISLDEAKGWYRTMIQRGLRTRVQEKTEVCRTLFRSDWG